ncbi:MAG TPA: S9 family peptidase [Streptosporangiaceae bacterium]
MTRGLHAGDMFRLRLAADPRLSAGGRYLAYVRGGLDREADRMTEDVVVTDLETGREWHPAPPRCRAGRPRWSADGRLAFAGDAGGTGQVWLWEPGDPAARPLAGSDGDGQVTDLDWAPDGSKIALTRAWLVPSGPEPGTAVTGGPYRVDGQPGLATARRRVQVVPVGPGAEPWEVPAGEAGTWLPRWSPDSARLAFLAGSRLRIADGGDTDGGDTDGRGPDPRPGPAHGPVLAFAWAPSGDELAYLAPRVPGEADVDVRLFRWAAGDADPDPGPAELAAGWDRSLGSTVRSDDGRGGGPPALAWSRATGRIYFTVADGGRGRIGWADPAGGGHGYLTGGDRACLDPSLDPAGCRIAFVSTSPAEPGDVHVADVSDGGAGAAGEHRVTDVNPWLRERPLAAARPVTAGEHDGVPVEGWVTAFGGPGGRPLVVSVHGGPHYPAGWRFSFEAQRLAARGYAVLTANPPGSGGYGRRFAAATRGGWGTADWAGLERLIDDVAGQPDIDAGRVAITGVSYGGYLSQLALTRSARFSAAISENGISNLLAAWGAEDDGGAWLTAELGGPPWERPQAYVAASPIAAADRIRTPLLLIHAELDRNCPVGQSEQMFAALRAQGRDAELFVIDGEGHLMNLTGRPSRRLARAQAVDRWLGRYLGQEGIPDDDR